MSDIDLPDAQWPGFSANGTVILPLPYERVLGGCPESVQFRGVQYQAKSEVHVTLLGAAAGKACREAIEQRRTRERALAQGFDQQQWRIRRTGRFIAIEDTDAPSPRRSIIELLDLPAMDRFREHCARECGIALPHAPPHVTLYVAGDPMGIGLPDDATLERFHRGEVPAEVVGRG